MSEEKKFSKFLTIWTGQFCSLLGSGVSAFGLSVWIFYQTGQATPFAMSFLCNILPGIMFAPFAGSFADRKNRKKVMIISDSLDAVLKILMAALLFTEVMKVWMVYPILFLSATFSAFQGPAYSASIPMLVRKESLSRANGLIQFSQAAQNLVAPVLAGILYPVLQLKGLLVIDFFTYFAALFTLVFVSIPQEPVDDKGNKKQGLKVVFGDFGESWRLVKGKRGFLKIILTFSLLNFIANIAMILIGPMVLADYSSAVYGTVQTIYAVAMVIGGLVSGILPECKNTVKRMFAVLSVSGIGLMIAGYSSFWLIIATGMFVFFFFVPYANALFQTYFQTSFDVSVLGRVGALVSAVLRLASPFACILAGTLADLVFEPLMKENGKLGSSIVGKIIGYGSGRGCGLMFIICGMVLFIVCITAMLRSGKLPTTGEEQQA